MLLKIPTGLDEIIATFGNLTPDYEAKCIVSFDLPYPLLYDGKPVHRARCHNLAVGNFQFAFERLLSAGLSDQCKNYGGIYQNRAIRGQSAHPSTHSWGIAIDLEPAQYPLGSSKRFPDEVVQIWRDAGFFYGGDFKSRLDPMHFQLAKAY